MEHTGLGVDHRRLGNQWAGEKDEHRFVGTPAVEHAVLRGLVHQLAKTAGRRHSERARPQLCEQLLPPFCEPSILF